uniref:Putative alpha/beta hydrolase 1 n=1 Tax=Amblyomma triste TaxID=251400 RepID=A0A023GM65_AMBTT
MKVESEENAAVAAMSGQPSKLELLVCTSCALYVFYYVLVLKHRPRLVCQPGGMRRFMTATFGDFLQGFYRTPIWCVGANLQSLVSSLYQKRLPEVSYRREYLSLPDGGRLALDWLNEDMQGAVLLVLPGLCGDSQAYYLRSFVPLARSLGCPLVVMNGRGRGGLPLATHRITHIPSVGDLTEVVDAVRLRYPDRCLVAVGYSLGGLLISMYLAKLGQQARIDAGLAISTPFHLPTAKRNLEQWWNSNFGVLLYMASNLVEHLKDNEDVLRATGKLSGVQRPLVFLMADDDVFGSRDTFPDDEIVNSRWLAAVVTPCGGHLGFVDGWLLPRPPFYSERFAATYVREILRVASAHGSKGLENLGEDC